MLLTKRQAMERLGVGEIRFLRLVKQGDLLDRGVTQAGGCRHNYKFQQRDVEALKRQLTRNGNGHGPAPTVQAPQTAWAQEPAWAEEPVKAPVREPPSPVASLTHRLTGIDQRLHVIEAGLDALRQSFDDLVRLWS